MRDNGIDEELHSLQRFFQNYLEFFFELGMFDRDFGNEGGSVIGLVGDEVEEGQVEDGLEEGFGTLRRLGNWSGGSGL